VSVRARRVVVYRDGDGLWRFKVQGMNWRTIDTGGGSRRRASVVLRAEREWPDVEVVIEGG